MTPIEKQCNVSWKGSSTAHYCGRPKGHKGNHRCRRIATTTGKRCAARKRQE